MQSIHSNLNSIFFSGICGTGMASLAVLLKLRGHNVSGSDENVYPPMSDFLAENNVVVHKAFSSGNLEPQPDLVVIGNALSRGNSEVEAILDLKLPYISMAELLKEHFIRGKTSLVVTGTHGKTTATSMLAWVFETAGKNPGFMIGGIAENFGTSCRDAKGGFFITEGDEYDTAFFDKRSKFFHYLPEQLILNNLEFDHADIFNSLDEIKKAFRLMLRLIPRRGLIAANGDDPNVQDVMHSANSPVIRFGFGELCDVRAVNIKTSASGTNFEVIDKRPGEFSQKNEFKLNLAGKYNVFNSLGVITLARHNGISDIDIQSAFDSFKSVRRRQELLGEVNGIAVYDDFAHHPTAVRETIGAIRQKHVDRRIIAVFEPRSNTCVRKVNQDALIDSLVDADEVILTNPYRVDQIPSDERLDVDKVVNSLRKKDVKANYFLDVVGIVEHLKNDCRFGDIVLIMSNGKFGNIHQRLLDAL